MSKLPLSILVVEDNEDDLFILKRSFKLAGTSNELKHVSDGQQAIDYLQGTPPFDQRDLYPLPSLVLLDLKLPMKHGLEVLHWVREQSVLDGLIVVVLTSSSEDRDIARAYELKANAFLVKPASAREMTEIVQALDVFWLKHNKYKAST